MHMKESCTKENVRDLMWIVGLMVFSRMVPHWPNMTAMGAIAILAPRWFKQNIFALLMPILALFISDAIIGFHSTMLFTYLAVFLVSLLSWKGAEKEKSVSKSHWLSWALGSSAIFYIITNFGAWLMLDMYTKDFSGLLLSYWNALPFMGLEFFGTVAYLAAGILIRQHWNSRATLSRVRQ